MYWTSLTASLLCEDFIEFAIVWINTISFECIRDFIWLTRDTRSVDCVDLVVLTRIRGTLGLTPYLLVGRTLRTSSVLVNYTWIAEIDANSLGVIGSIELSTFLAYTLLGHDFIVRTRDTRAYLYWAFDLIIRASLTKPIDKNDLTVWALVRATSQFTLSNCISILGSLIWSTIFACSIPQELLPNATCLNISASQVNRKRFVVWDLCAGAISLNPLPFTAQWLSAGDCVVSS